MFNSAIKVSFLASSHNVGCGGGPREAVGGGGGLRGKTRRDSKGPGAGRRPTTPPPSVSVPRGRRHGGPLGLPAPPRTGSPLKKEGRRAGTPRPRRRRKRAALAQLRRGRPALGARAGAGALEGAPRFGRKEAARPRTAGEGSVRARPRPPAPCRGQCATGTRGGATRSRAPRGSRPQRRWTLSRAPPAPRSEQPDLPAASSVWQMTRR